MQPQRLQRLLAALTITYCVLVAIGFAMPMIYYCTPGDGGRLMCQWAFNRHGQTDDVRHFTELWEAARVSVLQFHQFPSWNPYHCGGIVLFQHPEAPFPGPILLLTFFWLPAAAGIKVWIISHLIAGALGARKLVKDAGANIPEQMLAATLVTACGFTAEHFGGGHLSFTPFLLLPWILWAFRRSLREPRWAVLVAAIFAIAFYEGAVYPIPLMAVALGIDIITRLGHAEDRRAMYVSLPIIGVLFPLLSAARLLPVVAYLREHPRLMPLDDMMSVGEVVETWTARDHGRAFPGHVFVWPEYGDYVGWIPVLLMMGGVAYAIARRDDRTRSRRLDLAVFVGMVWCALGNIPGISLFGFLHQFPIYQSLRVPSRFLYPATVGLALMVTWALVTTRTIAVESGVRTRWLRVFVVLEVILALGVAADMIRANSPRIQQGLDPEVPRARASASFFQDPGANYGQFPTFPVQGIGTPTCYVGLEWGPARGLWMGDVPQERVIPAEAGEIRDARWSPSAVVFTAVLNRPATVLVNQNYETSWHSNVGQIHERDGIIAVDLPAGEHHVTVQHLAKGLVAGVLLFVLGLIATALLLWKLTADRVERMFAMVAKYARG